MENLSVAIKELETNDTSNNSFAILEDFFHEVFSYESLTTSTILIYGFGLIVGIFGPISIIWYERNCSNRKFDMEASLLYSVHLQGGPSARGLGYVSISSASG